MSLVMLDVLIVAGFPTVFLLFFMSHFALPSSPPFSCSTLLLLLLLSLGLHRISATIYITTTTTNNNTNNNNKYGKQ